MAFLRQVDGQSIRKLLNLFKQKKSKISDRKVRAASPAEVTIVGMVSGHEPLFKPIAQWLKEILHL